QRARAPFQRTSPSEPLHGAEELYEHMTLNPSREYDVRAIIARLVDLSEFIEYKAEYGKTLICGYARLGGWSVGIVANQKTHIREPGRAYEIGGVINTEGTDKAACVIMNCNQ